VELTNGTKAAAHSNPAAYLNKVTLEALAGGNVRTP